MTYVKRQIPKNITVLGTQLHVFIAYRVGHSKSGRTLYDALYKLGIFNHKRTISSTSTEHRHHQLCTEQTRHTTNKRDIQNHVLPI